MENSILGYTGKDIQDFHIYSRANVADNYSLILVFVDGIWEALLIDDATEKVVRSVMSARNEQNLKMMVFEEFKIQL